jgi:hypothetical protein
MAAKLDLPRLLDLQGRGYESLRKINPDHLRCCSRQFECRAAYCASQIESSIQLADERNELGDTTDRIKERIVRTERIGELILALPVMEQEILVNQGVGLVDVHRGTT